jgi:group I intron endonuclease
MKSGIYLIKNIANNKVYVGSAVNIDIRWSRHKYDLKEGKHHSQHLQSAWNKYGEQSFTFEAIEEVTNLEHLLAYEQVYLDFYKSYENDRGYNIYRVAGSPLGTKHSEETRKKISEGNKGKKYYSEEARKKISESNKRRLVSEETRRKLSKLHKGQKRTEETRKKISEIKKNQSKETRQKISEAKKGRKHSEETRQKISEAKKNISEETRQKMSEAAKRRNQQKTIRKQNDHQLSSQ